MHFDSSMVPPLGYSSFARCFQVRAYGRLQSEAHSL